MQQVFQIGAAKACVWQLATTSIRDTKRIQYTRFGISCVFDRQTLRLYTGDESNNAIIHLAPRSEILRDFGQTPPSFPLIDNPMIRPVAIPT